MDASQPWYIRFGTKILGVATAIVCLICGITTMISLSIGCIIAGVLLILISIVVFTLEAPFCCAMVPQLNRVSDFTEKRSPLQRTIFYAIAAILPLCICFGISTVFAALTLGGSCAFNVWRLIKQKRQADQTGTSGGVVIGSAPLIQQQHPNAGYPSQPFATAPTTGYGDMGGFQGQMFNKAAAGAVRGVMAGGYPGGGGGGAAP